MPFATRKAIYQSPADDESGSSGGGEDVATQIRKAVDEATTGLKNKNSELLGKVKEQTESLKRFDGIDPDAVRNILKRFSDDEEASLIAKGEIDTVLNKRTERMKADYEKKLADAAGVAEGATKRAQAFQGRVLDDAIRAAAAKAGIHQHAIEDALFRARAMFTLDENGHAVQLGDDGKPLLGKDGKSPFAPLEWLEGMKDKAPHWFPATASGSGAASSAANNNGKKTASRAQFDAMNQNERMAFSKAGGTVSD